MYKRWSEEEIVQLRELAKDYRDDEIAEMMHRTPGSIIRKRTSLGIKRQERPFVQKKWSEEEYAQLKELVKTHTEPEIAAIMHRTKGSIRGQKDILGLKSGSAWQAKDISQLRALVLENKSNQEIAKIMGRTRSSIQQAKEKLGFRDYFVRK